MKSFCIYLAIIVLSNSVFGYLNVPGYIIEQGGDWEIGPGGTFKRAPSAAEREEARKEEKRAAIAAKKREAQRERDRQLFVNAGRALQTIDETRSVLLNIVSMIAANEPLTEELKNEFNKTLAELRKKSAGLDMKQRSDLLVVNAWYSYLTGLDSVNCSKRCLSAVKLSPLSDIAYYSLATFYALSSQQLPSRESFLKENDTEITSDGRSLPFEIDYSPKQELLKGKKLSSVGISDKYFPGDERKNLTCFYVWRCNDDELTSEDEVYISESEVLSNYAKLNVSANSSDDLLRRSLAYAKELSAVAKKTGKFEVVLVNADKDATAAKEMVMEMGLSDVVFAQSDNGAVGGIGQNLSVFSKLCGNTIFLVDMQGKVRYAGSEFGIIFKMFIEQEVDGLVAPEVELVEVAGRGSQELSETDAVATGKETDGDNSIENAQQKANREKRIRAVIEDHPKIMDYLYDTPEIVKKLSAIGLVDEGAEKAAIAYAIGGVNQKISDRIRRRYYEEASDLLTRRVQGEYVSTTSAKANFDRWHEISMQCIKISMDDMNDVKEMFNSVPALKQQWDEAVRYLKESEALPPEMKQELAYSASFEK
jgi:hypothetical protein